MQPTLPPLFFSMLGEETQAVTASPASSSQQEESTVTIPAELLHHCLVAFSDWGDLAKLSCVQKGWSHTLYDAAGQSQEAKWELAQNLLQGTAGLAQNFDAAVRLLLELAGVETDDKNLPVREQNNNSENEQVNNKKECFSPAMKALAQCFFEGNGVSKNNDAGVAWLEAAAAADLGQDMDAAHELALVFEYGRHGVENDIVAAAEWFTKAATAGHIEAMAELGLCYELGCGVEQSDTDALDWYMKAANAGHITSKFSVAEAFEEARGVPQSDEEACIWYYKAAIAGDHDSKMALRRLEEIARIVCPGVRAVLDA